MDYEVQISWWNWIENRNKVSSFKLKPYWWAFPWSTMTETGKNNKTFKTIGSGKLDKFNCTYLIINPFLYIYPISLVFIPSYQYSLEIIFYNCTKYIPVSPVSIRELVPRKPPMPRHVSIHVNNYWCSVTPRVPPLECIIPYIFTVYPSILINIQFILYPLISRWGKWNVASNMGKKCF